MPQSSIRGALMRGGTSRGVFVARDDLPVDRAQRDALILEILGSPDPAQVDGLGGGISSTSKLMAIARSTRDGVDVDYLFTQVGIREAIVDDRGNCGNLTAAVAAYAIDEGLVNEVREPVTTVELYNENTSARIRARVPTVGGRAAVQGDLVVAGIPRPGAAVSTDFLEPAGSEFGALFPSSAPREQLDTPAGTFDVSIVDVSTPVVFVRAADVDVDTAASADVLNADRELLARLESIRGAAASRLGLVDAPEEATRRSSSLPRLALISAPRNYRTQTGIDVRADEIDLCTRALSGQRFHHAIPVTVLICAASAACLVGTNVTELAPSTSSPPPETAQVRVGHGKGIATASVRLTSERTSPGVAAVSVERTVRRIMAGDVYYRTRAAIDDRAPASGEGAW